MNARFQLAALPFAFVLAASPALHAQATSAPGAQTTAAPRQSGTVKAVTPTDFVLTNATGQDFAVNIAPTTRILLVDPATRDVKTAKTGSPADIAGGDKVIVTGTAGDTGQTLTAARVYVLKSGAIAAMHADEQAAWARSLGGIVRSVDPATGAITVANGARTYTVDTSPSTIVRRYNGASVRFEDATKSSVAAIRPGDQLQARGQRSADGFTVTADEIVTGSFSNFSGLITAVDPAANTLTLKDLATKKTVTVALTSQSNLRHLPPGFAQGMATHAGGEAGAPAEAQTGSAAAHPRGAGMGGPGGHMDLSRIVSRLPTETATNLKPGEAVMIVASNTSESGQPTVITMVSGVEQILAASPNGQTTLSPWSLGSGQGEGDASAGGAGGSGGR